MSTGLRTRFICSMLINAGDRPNEHNLSENKNLMDGFPLAIPNLTIHLTMDIAENGNRRGHFQ
uniref:Uncharacterized protein n=1 Tax=Romanomermis culicivorax TaxID=13658 RepID=A0A915JJ34_ROMCU